MGGNKQRGKIDKLDATSPTAALESVLLTAVIDVIGVIDAHERRDVAVINIPNAFVQTRLEDDKDKAIMRLRGKLAKLMVKVVPELYTKYVIINKKGETVLYVRLLNALYGIMKALLLYYQRFLQSTYTQPTEPQKTHPVSRRKRTSWIGICTFACALT